MAEVDQEKRQLRASRSGAFVRGLLLRFTVVALAVGLTLLLLEGSLRIFDLVPSGTVSTVTEEEYQRIPGVLAPGRSLIDRHIRELPHRVTVNSLGYRGDEFSLEKPPDEFRVLFVGDSFVYGSYVDDDESLPAQLQKELSSRCAGVRVINAGLGGSTIVSHRALAERGLSVDPDLVILLFSENDVTDFAVEPMWYQLSRNRALKARFPLRIVYPLLRETALWHLAMRARAVARARRPALAQGSPASPARGEGLGEEEASGGPFTERARYELRERYREEFVALRDTLGVEGIPLVFTAFPSHHTVAGRWPDEQIRWAHEMARELGVTEVDLLDPLTSSGLGEGLYLLPHDGHPNVDGYRLAATALFEHLLGHPVLAEPCQVTAYSGRVGSSN